MSGSRPCIILLPVTDIPKPLAAVLPWTSLTSGVIPDSHTVPSSAVMFAWFHWWLQNFFLKKATQRIWQLFLDVKFLWVHRPEPSIGILSCSAFSAQSQASLCLRNRFTSPQMEYLKQVSHSSCGFQSLPLNQLLFL